MMLNINKLLLIGAAALLLALFACYVQGLRADNQRLEADNTRLLAVNAASAAAFRSLQDQVKTNEKLLQDKAAGQEKIRQLQARLNQQINRELQHNENFKTWGAFGFSADAYRLLTAANRNRVSDCQADPAKPAPQ